MDSQTSPLIPSHVERRIRQQVPKDCFVIPGSTPVVSFGEPRNAAIATVGSNPGRSAFLVAGKLTSRYFETVDSLGDLQSASSDEALKAFDRCVRYFEREHHRRWFNELKHLVAYLGASYSDGSACHLDLVQWATNPIWGDLPSHVRRLLLNRDSAFFREQVQAAPRLKLLLLNGGSVLRDFQTAIGSLRRAPRTIAVQGVTTCFFAGELPVGERAIRVLGWDTNLQGTRGMTNGLRRKIAQCVAELAEEREGLPPALREVGGVQQSSRGIHEAADAIMPEGTGDYEDWPNPPHPERKRRGFWLDKRTVEVVWAFAEGRLPETRATAILRCGPGDVKWYEQDYRRKGLI